MVDYTSPRVMDTTYFRSAPGTPIAGGMTYGPYDSRDPRSLRLSDSGVYAGGLSPDYFSTRDPYGPLYHPASSQERGIYAHGIGTTGENVRRTNLQVSLANGALTPRSSYAQIHPMMASDGRYPHEFRTPMPIEEFRTMDRSSIDRILRFYGLPSSSRSSSASYRDGYDTDSSYNYGYGTSKGGRRAKLAALFEYLGAHRLADRQRGRPDALDLDFGSANFRQRRIGYPGP